MSQIDRIHARAGVPRFGEAKFHDRNRAYAVLEDSRDDVHLEQNRAHAGEVQQKRGFSVLRATGRFLQGAVVDTARSLFSTKGLVTMGIATAAAGVFGWPVLAAMGVVGVIGGGRMLATGIAKAIYRYRNGDNEGAENAFRSIGNGVATAGLSITALRGFQYKGQQILDGFKNGDKTGVSGAFQSVWGMIRAGFKKETSVETAASAPEAGTIVSALQGAVRNRLTDGALVQGASVRTILDYEEVAAKAHHQDRIDCM